MSKSPIEENKGKTVGEVYREAKERRGLPKSQEISTTVVGEQGITLDVPKMARLLDQSMSLLHHADLKEWQAITMRAAALWNIKTHRLHLVTDKTHPATLEEFAKKLGFGERAQRRYVQIGQKMFEMSMERALSEGGSVDPLSFTFTQKAISDVFEGFFTNGHTVTVEGLAQASSSLEAFKSYLAGTDELSEPAAHALLMQSNVVSDKQKERNEQSELTEKEQMLQFHKAREQEAEAHGLKWNRKTMCFTNLDGTALREEQIAEMTTPDAALRPWKDFYQVVAGTKKRIFDAVKRNMLQYSLYSKNVPNTAFTNTVDEINRDISGQLELLGELQECMLAMDWERMEELVREKV